MRTWCYEWHNDLHYLSKNPIVLRMEMNDKNYAKYCFIVGKEIFWILATALSYLSRIHTLTPTFSWMSQCLLFIYMFTLLLSRSDTEASGFTSKLLFLSLTAFIHIHTSLYMHRLTFMEAPRTAVPQKSNAVSVRCMYLTGRPHTLIVKWMEIIAYWD